MGACFSCSLCWENSTLVEVNETNNKYIPPSIELKEIKPNNELINNELINTKSLEIKNDIRIYDNFIIVDKYIKMIDDILCGKEILGDELEKLWLLYGDRIINVLENDGDFSKILLFKLHLMPDLIKFDNLIKFGRMIIKYDEQIGLILLSVKENELEKVMNKDEYKYLTSKKIHILMHLTSKYKNENKNGNLYLVYKYIGDNSGCSIVLNNFPEYVRKLI